MCCMPWRWWVEKHDCEHSHDSIHIVENKNRVVWAATKRIRRGGMSPWSMFLEGKCVPGLPLGKYNFCLTPFSTGDTLQPSMNMAPVHFLNNTTGVENNEGVLSAQSRFLGMLFTANTHYFTYLHTSKDIFTYKRSTYQSWQAASTGHPVCQLPPEKIQS